MKNAVLWKRVLNQGIGNSQGEDGIDNMTIKAIASPIIVDARSANWSVIMGQDWTGLSIPFREFWIEGVLQDHVYWGAIVMSEKIEGGQAIEIAGVLMRPSDPRPFFCGGYRLRIDDRGDTVPESRQMMVDPWRIQRDGEDLATYPCKTIGALVCDTLQILGCKNVSLEPRDNDPKQVRRAIKRHGGNADKYRYHVLVVRPPGAKPGTKGEEIGIMPRHVCRGHFSEYGPEFNKGLLFGKYAGRFYVPPHMKGKKENGEVAKDYAVK